MARRRKEKSELTPEQKREARRRKRQLRKQMAIESGVMPSQPNALEHEKNAHDEDQFWLGIRGRLRAEKVLNTWGVRPYWLSVRQNGTIPPLTGCFPCAMFNKNGRHYFGFLFRDHRDRTFARWRYTLGARKELTGPGQYPLIR